MHVPTKLREEAATQTVPIIHGLRLLVGREWVTSVQRPSERSGKQHPVTPLDHEG